MCGVGFVVSFGASHAVGHGFAPQQACPKKNIKTVQNASCCLACMRYGRSLTVQLDFIKGWVVCVYQNMHLKDLLGSIARVGYCIPVPNFYLLLHAHY